MKALSPSRVPTREFCTPSAALRIQSKGVRALNRTRGGRKFKSNVKSHGALKQTGVIKTGVNQELAL